MTTSAWMLSVRKELRALLPALVASVLVVFAAPFVAAPRQDLSILVAAYVLGALAIGAISVGHEYTFRTLSVALTRPVSRRAILGAKGAAVAAALGLLVAAALTQLPRGWTLATDDPAVQAVLVLPLLGAVCVAPWLTMVCRSTLAGMVFTGVLPPMAALMASWVHLPALPVLWLTSIVLALVGAVAGWRQFMTLEAIEGPGAAIALPEWLVSSHARDIATQRRSVLGLLASKELRLQQVPFIVSALFVVGFGGLWLAPLAPDVFENVSAALMVLYAVLFVVLVGALACAEEHRLGTVAWQVLLPVSARLQWAVKVGVVLTLSVVLGCILPAVLFAIASRNTVIPWNGQVIGLVTAASCAALYLSSISKDGLRAAMLCPVVVAGAIPLGAVGSVLGGLVFDVALPYADSLLGNWAPDGFSPSVSRWLSDLERYGMWLVLTGGTIVLLHAAFENYRTGYWNARRIVSQAARLVALLAVALVLSAVLTAARQDSMLRRVWAQCRVPGGVQCPEYVQDGPPFREFFRLSVPRRQANPR